MSARITRVVIVGAGHAGAHVAAFLRQFGFEGKIELVGEEPERPYQRPPLSKHFDAGESAQPVRPDSHYAEQRIAVRTSTRVAAIDTARRRVQCADGSELCYDALVLATGARNRRLEVPGADLERVHQLRTLADARALKASIGAGGRMVIVGGGYIGLEVAAAARRAGIAVTVLERESRLLPRVASVALSEFLADRHRRSGTEIRTGARVLAFESGLDGRLDAVVLADGERIACERVLVGIGAVPEDRLAAGAGLERADGVVVDARGATSAERVWAAGDATCRPVEGYEGRRRLESIPSATEQARQVAAAIAGAPAPAPEAPWFWSDQLDLKLQICGLLDDADTVTVRGDPDEGRFALFHTAADRLVAVEAVSAPREFMAGKALLRMRSPVDLRRLGDESVPLRELVRPGLAQPSAHAGRRGGTSTLVRA